MHPTDSFIDSDATFRLTLNKRIIVVALPFRAVAVFLPDQRRVPRCCEQLVPSVALGNVNVT